MEKHVNSSPPAKTSLSTIILSCLLSTIIGILVANSSTKLNFKSIFEDLKSTYYSLSGGKNLKQEHRTIPQTSGLISLLDQKYALIAVGQGKKVNIKTEIAEVDTKETEVGRTVVPIHPEADAARKLAAQMKAKGRLEKAKRLLQQCKSLSPHHPDVLNDYGEVVEEDDVIDAEHHYALALVFEPGHTKALENRMRTLPLVKQRDLEMLRRIEMKREALIQIPEGNAALQRAKMEAYYKHIYHSNAIEGNTMTLSMTRAIVETGMAIGGKSIHEHNEVIGLDEALKYINNTLLAQLGDIGVEDIVEIHKRVYGHVDPLEAGLFRKTQVYVGDHIPPGPSDIDRLMTEFDNWLYSRESEILHPIELAAISHYKLVFIHPFTDGNGRTSRLLMNLFLMQAGYPPVIIHKEQRFEYYDYLQQANLGDIRPFIRFVARCTERSLDEYLSSVTIYPRMSNSRRLQNEHKVKHTESLTSYDDLYQNIYNEECLNPAQNYKSLHVHSKICPVKK
eukprot:gene16899-18605_t